MSNREENPVGFLNERCQRSGINPTYEFNRIGGPDHAPIFEAVLTVPGEGTVTATGSKKKIAKNIAAKMLLDHNSERQSREGTSNTRNTRSLSRDRERRREKREKAERGGDGDGFRVKEEPADTGYNSYDYQGVNVKQEKLEEENGDGGNHANHGAEYDGY